MTTTHSSKVSYTTLVFIFLVFYVPLLPYLIKGYFTGKILTATGLLTLAFIFIVHLFFKTRYTIDYNKLHIKCGFFSYQPIAIANIKEVTNTNSILASPAPSFDRIAITYGEYGRMIISPKDKMSFVNDLQRINPDIKNSITE